MMSRQFIVMAMIADSLASMACAFLVPGFDSQLNVWRRNHLDIADIFVTGRIHSAPLLASMYATEKSVQTTDFLICGGGPTGLLAAIMLARKFPSCRITVHDRQRTPASPTDDKVWDDTSRHYLIGLGGRGLTSLEAFGIDILPYAVAVPGRKDWTPEQPKGVESVRTDRKYGTQVLPRDKLVSILHEVIIKEYKDQVELHFESRVRPLDFAHGDDHVLVEVSAVDDETWTPVLAKMVLATDGSARTFANQMEEIEASTDNPFQVVRFKDDNVRVYKALPFRLPKKQWLIDNPSQEDIFWNYAVRSEKSRIIFDALPANDRGDYVGILLMRADEEMAQQNVDPALFTDFLRQEVPQFIDLIDSQTIAASAANAASSLPQFRYVTPRMHQGQRTVLMGDCAHSVKPFFGMGCNTALEDVKLLGECLEKTPEDWTKAIYSFSNQRTVEMKTMVQTSRDLDRPGLVGVFAFLIPIIMDGIFFKLAPEVFQPNIISLMQNEEYTFQEAVQRKQRDRAGQLVILGTLLYLLGVGFRSMAAFL